MPFCYKARMLRPARTFLLLRMVQLKALALMSEALADTGLTPNQYAVLSIASHHEEWSTSAMARRFTVSTQSMNETVGALEKKGLITRRESPEHRRILHIRLTSAGTRTLARAERAIDAVEKEAFGALSGVELAQFRDYLGRALSKESSEERAVARVKA